MAPSVTIKRLAAGGSISVFGRAIISIPFSIVPVFSKSEVMERSTQPDIWFSRSVSAFAAAIAPSEISPFVHSQIDSAAATKMKTEFRIVSAAVIVVMVRFMRARGGELLLEGLAAERLLALGMREELDRDDIGEAVDDAAGQAGIRLRHGARAHAHRRHQRRRSRRRRRSSQAMSGSNSRQSKPASSVTVPSR